MQHHQRLLLGGWHVLGRIGLLEVATKFNLNLFFGEQYQLLFEFACWWWQKATPFFTYLAKEGRKWITKQDALNKPILHKLWNGIPPSASPKWNIIWHKAKAQNKKKQIFSGRSSIR